MATQTTRGHATWTTAWAWAMLAGSALLLGGLAARMVRLARWRRTWRPARGDWRALVRRAARDVGMDRPFGVFVASGLSQPAATGILAPAVVLPESHAALSAPVARAVLAHELAHLKDRDPLWALIGHAMVAATWWCPLSWRLRRRAKRESELTADDHALAAGVSARDLAGALAGFAEQDNLRGVPATVSGMACHLTRRIEMILRSNQPHCPKMSRASRAVLSATACLLAAVLAAAPLTGVARGEAASKPATEGKDTSTRPAREGEATRPAREGDRRDGDPVPVDRTLKGMPAELADMARPILLAREEAIAQANRRAAEGLLALAARAEVSGDRDGAIRLWLLVVRISPKNEQAVAALRRAGVNPSAEGPPKAGGKDGEGPRRIGPPDGGGPAREAPKEAPKEGAAPAREGQRENEGASRPAPKDGEGAVRTAPREGG